MSSLDLPTVAVAVPSSNRLTTVLKRDGRAVPFDRERIVRAIEMAFRAERGTPYPDPLALLVYDQVEQVTDAVIAALAEGMAASVETVEIERIQDEVGISPSGRAATSRTTNGTSCFAISAFFPPPRVSSPIT